MDIDFSQPMIADVLASRARAQRRGCMVVSRLQGGLTLGADVCGRLDAIAGDPDTPWAMREAIVNAAQWERTSETMNELAYVPGCGPEAMDTLFEMAALVKV